MFTKMMRLLGLGLGLSLAANAQSFSHTHGNQGYHSHSTTQYTTQGSCCNCSYTRTVHAPKVTHTSHHHKHHNYSGRHGHYGHHHKVHKHVQHPHKTHSAKPVKYASKTVVKRTTTPLDSIQYGQTLSGYTPRVHSHATHYHTAPRRYHSTVYSHHPHTGHVLGGRHHTYSRSRLVGAPHTTRYAHPHGYAYKAKKYAAKGKTHHR